MTLIKKNSLLIFFLQTHFFFECLENFSLYDCLFDFCYMCTYILYYYSLKIFPTPRQKYTVSLILFGTHCINLIMIKLSLK